MTKYIVEFTRTEYATVEVEAEGDAELMALLDEYDEYDLNWHGDDVEYSWVRAGKRG